MDIIIENVRCFYGKHRIPLFPLTLLVGENSTGKSTFLSILSVMSDQDRFPLKPGFNIPPFDMGGFESIVAHDITKRDSGSFKIGFNKRSIYNPEDVTTVATYKSFLGQVVPKEFNIINNKTSLRIGFGEKKTGISFTSISNGIQKKQQFYINKKDRYASFIESQGLMALIALCTTKAIIKKKSVNTLDSDKVPFLGDLYMLIEERTISEAKVISFAPIRTKPRRTYETYNDEFKPEGDHIPLRLARHVYSCTNEENAKAFENIIRDFGADSGLFSYIQTKRLGDSHSAPIQLIVEIGGKHINLADVGYGVSQSLPIVVESILDAPRSMYLLQQPEVHLHPKAQAALGSFFSKVTQQMQSSFIIETHSDYLIDRVRQEIAKGTIDKDKVGILYFSKTDEKSNVYPMRVDNNGNIINPPRGYRDFFLKEQLSLLSRV